MRIVFPESATPARRVAARIRRDGGEAYLIGGCVRDLCLGRAPKDYDLATSLPPERLAALFPGANETGKCFGVLRVRLGGDEIEVATYRRDGPYSDGRRPDFVEYTSLDQDIHRRDFTVNALAADPETGEVIDHVDGLADLEKKLIRAVGVPEERFHEDKLRLIRAVRFAHVLGFAIEPSTWDALRRKAADIKDVAMERVSEELTKIIRHVPAGSALRLLDESGLLEPILPELLLQKGVMQPEAFHPEGDVFVHTCLVLDALRPDPSTAVAWAALLHDVGKPETFMVTDRIRFHGHAELGMRMARRICRRFRLSNEITDRVAIIILEHMRFHDIDKMRPGRLLHWAGQPHFAELLEVHRADCVASHGDMTAHETALKALAEIERLAALPPHLVTGRTLQEMGLEPGPRFRTIIEQAYEAQLEGRFDNEDAGRQYVREHLLVQGNGEGKG